MATTVQTGGGGVDLSELTSGELLLIFLLNNKWEWGVNRKETYGISGTGRSYQYNTGFYVDLRKISAMTFQVRDARGGVIQNYSWNSVSNDGYYRFDLQIAGDGVCCTSFTTTDGKVHTKDNLNY